MSGVGNEYCSICGIYFNSCEQHLAHKDSESHLATMKKIQEADNYRRGEEADYVLDDITKKGWCHVCSVELSSQQQADDHLGSKGHEKKKRMREALLSSGSLPSVNQEPMPNHGLSRDTENSSKSLQKGFENLESLTVKEKGRTSVNLPRRELYSVQHPTASTSGITEYMPTSLTAGFNNPQMSKLETSCGVRNQSQLEDGKRQDEEGDYLFDNISKKGWCHVCSVELSSQQQADDHLRSRGHERKKKMRDILPSHSSMPAATCAVEPNVPPNNKKNSSSLHRDFGKAHDSVLKRQNEASDATSSFFIESCDIPDDLPSARINHVQFIAPNALNLQPDSRSPFLPAAYNDLNRAFSEMETSVSSNTSQKTYTFDEVKKKGWCFVCNVELSSVQQADDHLSSAGHERKKAKDSLQKCAGLSLTSATAHGAAAEAEFWSKSNENQSRSEKQKPFGNYNIEHIKEKGLLESGQKIFDHDHEQTKRKELFQSDNFPNSHSVASGSKMFPSENQTYVKTFPNQRPTAVVSPRNAIPQDESSARQREENDSVLGSGIPVDVPNTPMNARNDDDFYCDVCNVQSTSREMNEQHRRGRQHRTKIKSLRGQSQDTNSKKVSLSLNLNLEINTISFCH